LLNQQSVLVLKLVTMVFKDLTSSQVGAALKWGAAPVDVANDHNGFPAI
jgi:hypothetical protein